jgi:hypothetical protein
MSTSEIIKAVIPGASEDECGLILWSYTAFPFFLTAKSLYKAASRYKRAKAKGRVLCMCCPNEAEEGKHLCIKCKLSLKRNDYEN